ncbi:uncharacterized protein LOC113790950 [Dermatophagoides pteronyssinus]|uniref:uncharacterized protein LOC113790950 n=1 Tax=Dermatophagoides pteronyssinus TaxID=6956 RepID=UPI003F673CCB
MGLFHSPKCRLLSMLCLTFFFFLVEIIVGYLTNSTALIADSFHMLSDVVALVIAYVSVRMSPKKWSKNTFGWARAEVLGALINAVFLVALCFSILIESLKRIVDPEKLHNPILILVVGIIGLCVNLIGLLLFHEHGHSHGGHIHIPQQEEIIPPSSSSSQIQNGDIGFVDEQQKTKPKKIKQHTATNMNMRGVFLHVLADALGSIIVIISALIVQYTEWEYNIYVDPALSIIMVIIIGHSTFPLLIDSALILLQTVPTHIQIDSLQRKLLQEIDGVLAVHEFHVWQLAGDRIIASAHIRCRNLHDYMQIAERVKEFFHNEGIHSTTIQPEFVEADDTMESSFDNGAISDGHWSSLANAGQQDVHLKYRWSNDANCALDCPPGQLGRGSCVQSTCCGPQQKRSLPPGSGFDELEIQKAGSSIGTQLSRRNIHGQSINNNNQQQLQQQPISAISTSKHNGSPSLTSSSSSSSSNNQQQQQQNDQSQMINTKSSLLNAATNAIAVAAIIPEKDSKIVSYSNLSQQSSTSSSSSSSTNHLGLIVDSKEKLNSISNGI